uniref:Uncharacterized protein n=1 Tax=Oryzias latipes TaxID=8090 RepID=A0A3P9M433_ORYLA
MLPFSWAQQTPEVELSENRAAVPRRAPQTGPAPSSCPADRRGTRFKEVDVNFIYLLCTYRVNTGRVAFLSVRRGRPPEDFVFGGGGGGGVPRVPTLRLLLLTTAVIKNPTLSQL